MPLNKPSLPKFHASITSLKASYLSEREKKDNDRFFSSIRSGTDTTDRVADVSFVERVAESVITNQRKYKDIDADYQRASFDNDITPFLKKVIAGALLFNLINIIDQYGGDEDVMKNGSRFCTGSALANCILGIFHIEKLSEDVGAHEVKECLEALQKYLIKVPKAFGLEVIWHNLKSNDLLQEEIQEKITRYSSAPVCQ